MAEPPKKPRAKPRNYDPDTRMLAFLGSLTLLVGSLFWVLVGLRLVLGVAAPPPAHADIAAAAALALGPVGMLAALASWGLRAKLEAGEPVGAWHLRYMMIAGLVVGVVVGFVVYVGLAYKLRDPGFVTVAGEPSTEFADAR